IRASQSGNENFLRADDVLQSVAVKADQTITFPAIANRRLAADEPPLFSVSASASSGLPVTISKVSCPATISNNLVQLQNLPGVVTLRADQPGNNLYNAATTVIQSFGVGSVVPTSTGSGKTASGTVADSTVNATF